jgi:hypothetical protein
MITALILLIGFLLALKYFGPSVLDIESLKWIIYLWGAIGFAVATTGLSLAVWIHARRTKAERETPLIGIAQLEAQTDQIPETRAASSNEEPNE